MATRSMWMVRSGAGGAEFETFRDRGVVAIGWGMEDWTKYPSKETILARIAAANPEASPAQNQVGASQVERFLREFRVGDRVVTYDPKSRAYLVGTIQSEARYDPACVEALPTCRKVKWEGSLSRDDLTTTARNSLGAISTLFRVADHAMIEIEAQLSGAAPARAATPDVQAQEPAEDLLGDVRARAREFIKDRISALDWAAMQELVAGILRAMGYKTRVSPAGPDRGKDIVASPDGLGFESPRIVVEVKHRRGAMGSNEIRSFVGGRHKDDKGLYVSTGGFTKEAHYEAERASIPVTLMDLDDLADAVTEYYERMDPEARALVPLTRVYWPT
jgi:restriction system protein